MVSFHTDLARFEPLPIVDGACFHGQFAKSDSGRLRQLALGLQASPILSEMSNPAIVVRESGDRGIGLIGTFDDVDRSRIEALRWQLTHVVPHTTYIGYDDFEHACLVLSTRLRESLGDDLSRYRLTAIPRGGWFVLGVMSYLLDFDEDSVDDDAPTIVLDDVAYSGDRFARYLDSNPARDSTPDIVFAPVFSAAELRASIEQSESRVIAAVSANDLMDHAPDRMGAEYESWRVMWSEHDPRYWDGQPDHVAFPWNEPDIRFWNGALSESESGWRLIPPSHCLKNRAGPTPIQVVPEWNGDVRLADDTIYGTIDGVVVAAGGGDMFRFTGSAASIWNLLAAHESASAAATALSAEYAIEVEVAVADVDEFVDSLVDAGVLTKHG